MDESAQTMIDLVNQTLRELGDARYSPMFTEYAPMLRVNWKALMEVDDEADTPTVVRKEDRS